MLSIDLVKLIRPYLYNNLYNRQDAMINMMNDIKETGVCTEPSISYYPYCIHIPLKKVYCKEKTISRLSSELSPMINLIVFKSLVRYQYIAINAISDIISKYKLNINPMEMYQYVLQNVAYLYTYNLIPSPKGYTIQINL